MSPIQVVLLGLGLVLAGAVVMLVLPIYRKETDL